MSKRREEVCSYCGKGCMLCFTAGRSHAEAELNALHTKLAAATEDRAVDTQLIESLQSRLDAAEQVLVESINVGAEYKAKLAAAEALIEQARVTAVGWDDVRVNLLTPATIARMLSSVECLHRAVVAYDQENQQ